MSIRIDNPASFRKSDRPLYSGETESDSLNRSFNQNYLEMMASQNQLIDSAESMNKALLSLYESRLPEINELIEQCIEQDGWVADKISRPFFMQVDEAYIHAPAKILFIGRETYGWDKYDRHGDASDIINSYKSSYEAGKHHNSPFWWFRKDFSQANGINKESFMRATLWTNLSKIDVGKKKPSGREFGHLSQIFINLLVEEIAIVKPDVILIMTIDGYYKWHIDN